MCYEIIITNNDNNLKHVLINFSYEFKVIYLKITILSLIYYQIFNNTNLMSLRFKTHKL